MTKYPLLSDEKFLIDKYCKEFLSTLQISKIIGCSSPNSVVEALKKLKVPIRNRSEGQRKNKISKFIDNPNFIEGSLLGDGYLHIANRNSLISRPSYEKKNIHEDHIKWFAESIDSEPTIKYVERLTQFPNRAQKTSSKYFQYSSKAEDSLMPYLKRWYPDGKKVVPQDLTLSRVKLLNWFLDDGFSTYKDRTKERARMDGKPSRQNTTQILLVLCSQSFTREENEFLLELLLKEGIKGSVGKIKNGSGCHIVINQSQVKNFFEYIGECPVESLKYKWKL